MEVQSIPALTESEGVGDTSVVTAETPPEITDITPILLSNLTPVRGMVNNFQILVHGHKSVSNDLPINFFEMDLALMLARHFLFQNYSPKDLIIVTTNNLQAHNIRQGLRYLSEWDGENIAVVLVEEYIMNSQLKQNIAIVSFANLYDIYNTDGTIAKNLVSKAEYCFDIFSRKHTMGLYIVTHASMFNASGNLRQLAIGLQQLGCLGTDLKLICQNHLLARSISSAETLLEQFPFGGCLANCSFLHPICLHPCLLQCHSMDRDHKTDKYVCKLACEKKCVNGHSTCKNLCCENCSDCEIQVEKLCSRCHNEFKGPCFLSSSLCMNKFSKTFPCKHELDYFCYQTEAPETIKCHEKINKQLYCGHTKFIFCWRRDLAVENKCQEIITYKRHPKITNHTSEVKIKCCDKDNPKVTNCPEILQTEFKVDCGHRVLAICHQHESWDSTMLTVFCEETCDVFDISCRHKCAGSCKECFHGIFHIRCASTPCTKIQLCGHPCTSSCCSQICFPCKRTCKNACEHGKCNEFCSFACQPCLKPCLWKCPHYQCTMLCSEPCNRPPCLKPCPIKLRSCGHDCSGFCGEKCPPICRICNELELEGCRLLVADDSKESRYIWLSGCDHILDYESLSALMQTENDNHTGFKYKTCPFCRSIIWNCRPFDVILSKVREEALRIKSREFGDPTDILAKQRDVFSDLLTTNVSRNGQEGLFYDFKCYLLKCLCGSAENIEVGNFLNMPKNVILAIETFGIYYINANRKLKTLSSTIQTGYGGHAPKEVRKMQEYLVDIYNRTFGFIMSRPIPLYSTEVRDLHREFNRISDLHRVINLRVGWDNEHPRRFNHSKIEMSFYRSTSILQALRPYTQPMRRLTYEPLKAVDLEAIERLIRDGLNNFEDEPY